MFQIDYLFSRSTITDCVALLERLNMSDLLVLDNCSVCGYIFYMCSNLTRAPKIKITYTGTLKHTSTFANCSKLVTIEEFCVQKNHQYSTTFTNCTALENLNVTGTIGQNGFDVKSATKLTHDSLMSIINALEDKSADTSGTTWKVTVGTTNLNKLTNEEKAIATAKGWTLA